MAHIAGVLRALPPIRTTAAATTATVKAVGNGAAAPKAKKAA